MAVDDRNPDPAAAALPEGIWSLLDTDLYKLTMQCAVLKYFPDVEVSYSFTNRTQDKKLNRAAYNWLQVQIAKLSNVRVTEDELRFLETSCPYLNDSYLSFLRDFHLKPAEQIKLTFTPLQDTGSDDDAGDLSLQTKGRWVDTILYEIPLLALTSEAYFKFVDKDWDYHGQEEKAYKKGCALLENGCIFSEFGSRRRRDYHTQDVVMAGLKRAAKEGAEKGWRGKLSGTSNVHFAMKHGVLPVGTVAHEWFMGIAAVTNNYENANEIALRYWVGTFGGGVLGIALTDTFGTPTFLKAFKEPCPLYTTAIPGGSATTASAATTTQQVTDPLAPTQAPVQAPIQDGETSPADQKSYAQVFTGVRQDSGDPAGFVKMMRDFYDTVGIKEKKTIVFSDSLNIENCIEYLQIAEEAGFQPTFGVGTFFTNDYVRKTNSKKSVPLNIVIKLSHANGNPAIKISDNIGKNTGDKEKVAEVKRRLGYVERDWVGGNESTRWGKEGEAGNAANVKA